VGSARRVRGALAAALTPLTVDGEDIDRDGIHRLVDFYRAAGLDGLLALGSTGEGILLPLDQRRAVAEQFISAAAGGLAVLVHCGAQTTHDTAALAEHAAASGADGIAVIPPPYYPLDPEAILRHLSVAAAACAPVPFYAYEFAARSGYAIPVNVLERLGAVASNLAGLKVSDDRFDLVAQYMLDGLDVYVGAEALIHQGLERGAAGAVSGLAAALPELVIEAVRSRSAEASARAGTVRAAIQRFPMPAALKSIVVRRGVAVSSAVRAPLRDLDAEEQAALLGALNDLAVDLAPLTGQPSP